MTRVMLWSLTAAAILAMAAGGAGPADAAKAKRSKATGASSAGLYKDGKLNTTIAVGYDEGGSRLNRARKSARRSR